MIFVRAIHIVKAGALATALNLFLLIISTNNAQAVLVDDIITLKDPKPFTDIEMEEEGGKRSRLSDYRGQYVLLNIWATWCPPCVHELPMLDELQTRYAKDGLKVIALSQDAAGIPLVQRFYQRNEISLTPYSDPGGAGFKALGIKSLPMTYLINPQGEMVADIVGEIDWLSNNNIKQMERFLRAEP